MVHRGGQRFGRVQIEIADDPRLDGTAPRSAANLSKRLGELAADGYLRRRLPWIRTAHRRRLILALLILLPSVVANKVAVFLVGGWHDAFQRGAPLNYAALQNAYAGRPDEQPMQPGQPVSEGLRLMMGPWYHVSDFGGLHLHALQLRWFDYWLNDEPAAAISGSPFTFQAIGSPRWFHAREYPLAEATPTPFYLSQSGHLTAECAPETSTATIKYVGRGPLAGRSVEQWTLGMTSFIRTQRGGQIRYPKNRPLLLRRFPCHATAPVVT